VRRLSSPEPGATVAPFSNRVAVRRRARLQTAQPWHQARYYDRNKWAAGRVIIMNLEVQGDRQWPHASIVAIF
jgi:hypothetical protein